MNNIFAASQSDSDLELESNSECVFKFFWQVKPQSSVGKAHKFGLPRHNGEVESRRLQPAAETHQIVFLRHQEGWPHERLQRRVEQHTAADQCHETIFGVHPSPLSKIKGQHCYWFLLVFCFSNLQLVWTLSRLSTLGSSNFTTSMSRVDSRLTLDSRIWTLDSRHRHFWLLTFWLV